VLLIGTQVVEVEAVAAILRREGIGVATRSLDSLEAQHHFAQDTSHVVLILREHAVIPVGDKTRQVSKALPSGTAILLCTTPMSMVHRKKLSQCGATKIVSPAGWQAARVAERILAEFILVGAIQPVSIGSLYGA